MSEKPDFWKQSEIDSAAFIPMVERYGITGVLSALQNVLRYRDDRTKCSNKVSVTFNSICALSKCITEIKNWEADAK